MELFSVSILHRDVVVIAAAPWLAVDPWRSGDLLCAGSMQKWQFRMEHEQLITSPQAHIFWCASGLPDLPGEGCGDGLLISVARRRLVRSKRRRGASWETFSLAVGSNRLGSRHARATHSFCCVGRAASALPTVIYSDNPRPTRSNTLNMALMCFCQREMTLAKGS